MMLRLLLLPPRKNFCTAIGSNVTPGTQMMRCLLYHTTTIERIVVVWRGGGLWMPHPWNTIIVVVDHVVVVTVISCGVERTTSALRSRTESPQWWSGIPSLHDSNDKQCNVLCGSLSDNLIRNTLHVELKRDEERFLLQETEDLRLYQVGVLDDIK